MRNLHDIPARDPFADFFNQRIEVQWALVHPRELRERPEYQQAFYRYTMEPHEYAMEPPRFLDDGQTLLHRLRLQSDQIHMALRERDREHVALTVTVREYRQLLANWDFQRMTEGQYRHDPRIFGMRLVTVPDA